MSTNNYKIRSFRVDMTPELAQSYLDTQVRNRQCNERWVDTLCESILRGEWVDDGNSIKMDDNGHLIDGQHRLKALIKSGKTLQMEVKSGFDRDAIFVIDAFTKTRSLSDVANLNGIHNANNVASIVRAYYNEKLLDKGILSWTKKRLSPSMFVQLYNDRADQWQMLYRELSRVENGKAGRLKLLPASYVGGICAFLIFDKNHPQEQVLDFFRQLQSTKPAQNVTVEKLRSILIRNAVQNKRFTSDARHAIVAKTWNAYITGRTIRSLRIGGDETHLRFI